MALFGDFESVRELNQTGFTTLLLAKRAGTEERPRFVVKTSATPAAVASTGAVHDQAESFLEAAKLQETISDRRAQYWAPIHGSGMARGEPFYVTDYYPRSAQSIVASKTRIGPRQLHAIVDSVVRGLVDFKTICRRPHGNLKPTNVLLTGEKNSDVPKTFLIDPCPTEQLSPEATEELDLQGIGQLIFQMVTHREAPKIATWPLEMPREFKRLGRQGPMWMELVNKLLSPIDPARYTKLEDVLPVLPKLKPKRTGRALAVLLSLAAIGSAAFMMHHYRYDPRPVVKEHYQKVKAWVMRTPATQPVDPVVKRTTTGPTDLVAATQPTTKPVVLVQGTGQNTGPTTQQVATTRPAPAETIASIVRTTVVDTTGLSWPAPSETIASIVGTTVTDTTGLSWPATQPVVDKTVIAVVTTQPTTKPLVNPAIEQAIRMAEIGKAREAAAALLVRLDGGASVVSIEKELSALREHRHAGEIKVDLRRVEARLEEFKAVESAKERRALLARIEKSDDVLLGLMAYRRLDEVESPAASLDEDHAALQTLTSRLVRVPDAQRQREWKTQLEAEAKLHWIGYVSSLKDGLGLATAMERTREYGVTDAEAQEALRKAVVNQHNRAAAWRLVESARAAGKPLAERHWLKEAARLKDPRAMEEMGLLLLTGAEGVPKDEKEAAEMLQAAADAGSKKVAMPLAELYIEGRGGVEQNVSKAAPLLRMAADDKDAKAQRMYGQMLLHGVGVRKDEKAGAGYLRAAADNGDVEAMTGYAVCLQQGRGVARDASAAVSWFERAAVKGDANAAVFVAEEYRTGKGTLRKDVARAFQLFEQAAKDDHVVAMVRLAYMYDVGEGTARNPAFALKWYERAARTQDKDANFALGYAYVASPSIKHDADNAIRYLEVAAQQGHKQAMRELAACYRKKGNAEKAAYWEERAK